MSETRTKLKTFIQNELARDHGDVDVEKESLVESGIIDSLGIMKLVEFVENTFSVKIGDDDLIPENFETLDDVTKLVDAKR